jgi:hypothetical protein
LEVVKALRVSERDLQLAAEATRIGHLLSTPLTCGYVPSAKNLLTRIMARPRTIRLVEIAELLAVSK